MNNKISTDNLSNKAQQAWASVKGQLRLEMDKPTFDTWVNQLEFVDFDGRFFHISTVDEKVHAWVTSRLTSTIERKLAGLLNTTLEVVFSVRDPDSIEEGSSIDTAPESMVDIQLPEQFDINLIQSLRDSFLNPGQVHVFPTYLFRWVPYLKNTSVFWTLLGYRQAFYLNLNSPVRGYTEFSVSARSIARLIGSSKNTIEAHRDSGKLDWFLSYTRTRKYITSNNTIHRVPFSYRFNASAPPTPGDHDRLIEWLYLNGVEKDPQAALRHLLNTSVSEILGDPQEPATQTQLRRIPRELSFSKAIIEVLDMDNYDKVTTNSLLGLTEKAQEHLVESFGIALVPLYFMQHYLPLLGHTAALAVIMLRRQIGYLNLSSKEIRGEGLLKGGQKALADSLGVRLTTLRRFFIVKDYQSAADLTDSSYYEKGLRAHKRLLFSGFVQVVKASKQNLRLNVAMSDIMIPAHEFEYSLLIGLATAFLKSTYSHDWQPAEQEERVGGFLDTLIRYGLFDLRLIDEEDSAATLENEVDTKKAPWKSDKIQDWVNNEIQIWVNDKIQNLTNEEIHTWVNNKNQKWVNKNIQNWVINKDSNLGHIKYLIKYLHPNTYKNYLIHITNSITPTTISQGPQPIWVTGEGDDWNIKRLFTYSKLSISEIEQLIQQKPNPKSVLSIILQTFGPDKEKFSAPWRYIKSRIMDDPKVSAPGIYNYLAQLSPDQLSQLFQHSSRSNINNKLDLDKTAPGAVPWREYLTQLKSEMHLWEIAEILGLLRWS